MGLKESGLRGSLRNVSVDIDAIPDSAIYWWNPSNFDSAGWDDEVQEETMSIEGLEASTFVDGSDSVEAENPEDLGEADIMEDIIRESFTIEFELETNDSSSEPYIFGGFADGPDDFFMVSLNADASRNSDDGNIVFRFRDASGSRTRFAFDNAPDLNDGDLHTVTVAINDLENGDVDLYFDGESKDEDVDSTGADPDNFGDIDLTRFGVMGRFSDDENLEDGITGNIGILAIHDEAVEPTI